MPKRHVLIDTGYGCCAGFRRSLRQTGPRTRSDNRCENTSPVELANKEATFSLACRCEQACLQQSERKTNWFVDGDGR